MPVRFTNEGIKETAGCIHLELNREFGPGHKTFGITNLKVGIKSHGMGRMAEEEYREGQDGILGHTHPC